jgi:hypothetical protein
MKTEKWFKIVWAFDWFFTAIEWCLQSSIHLYRLVSVLLHNCSNIVELIVDCLMNLQGNKADHGNFMSCRWVLCFFTLRTDLLCAVRPCFEVLSLVLARTQQIKYACKFAFMFSHCMVLIWIFSETYGERIV